MNTPKFFLILAVVGLVNGCASLTRVPSEAQARRLEAGRVQSEREAVVSARAAVYQKEGLSSREATLQAETEYKARGGR